MAWPNPNQYAEAVQNPRLAFSDPALQRGTVSLNQYKLPRPISGNFATVFEIEGIGKRWAVRCFLREVTNHQQRYAAISAHLHNHPLDFMVGFEYLPQGIRVINQWYPILKMDWMRGVQLDRYIEDHLNNPATLEALANQWVTVCRQLREADLAHGDLQHGNILVTEQGQFILIDYDGMVIPSLIGSSGNEIGHRHYQHPSRTSDQGLTVQNFRNIDNFSAQVIGNSLYALAIDPMLWGKTSAGVENLLFRDIDFKDPNGSKTLNLMRNHADARIRTIARRMTEAITVWHYLEVSPLERMEPARGAGIGRWLADHLPTPSNSTTATAATCPSNQPSTVPEWLRDHVDPQATVPLEFPDDFIRAERLLIEREFQASLLRWFRPLFRQFASAKVHDRFATYPVARDKVQLEDRLELLRRDLARLQLRISSIPQHVSDIRLNTYNEVRAADQAVQQMGQGLNDTWRLEREELDRLEQYLLNSLRKYRLTANSVVGIGKARVAALHSVGVLTAADVQSALQMQAMDALQNVRGANPLAEWQALETWRDALRRMVKPPPPTIARSGNAATIGAAYASLRRAMKLKQDELQQEAMRVRAAVLQNEQMRLQTLNAESLTLERQIRDILRQLQRYSHITHDVLVEKIINVPGVGA